MDSKDALHILMMKQEQQLKQMQLLNLQLQSANDDKHQLRLQVVTLQNDASSLRHNIELQDRQLKDQDSLIAELKQRIDAYKTKELVGMSPVIPQQAHSNNSNKQELMELMEKNTDLLIQNRDYKEQIDNQQVQISALQLDNQQLKQQLIHHAKVIQQNELSINAIERKFTQLQYQPNIIIEQLSKEVNRLNAQIIEHLTHEQDIEYRIQYEQLKVKYDKLNNTAQQPIQMNQQLHGNALQLQTMQSQVSVSHSDHLDIDGAAYNLMKDSNLN